MDMPVSLAVGTVRTPEFPVKPQPYLIMIRAEKRMPFDDMNCMLGLATPMPEPKCNKEPLLQADWAVWDEGQVVDHGSVHRRDGRGGWADASIDRFLGFCRRTQQEVHIGSEIHQRRQCAECD